jgi:hypothetical protein
MPLPYSGIFLAGMLSYVDSGTGHGIKYNTDIYKRLEARRQAGDGQQWYYVSSFLLPGICGFTVTTFAMLQGGNKIGIEAERPIR